ncbi:MAG TPA: Rieske 2Fe-2S domain-containing protein [Alphaproteobacteria bacterium]|jgi:5,5'-dehydrodivanillate O-demethylase
MTPEQNEAMTRVGPGTPGGEFLRRYWWPVWFTQELKDKPVEIRLLGESFVLFRKRTGEAGMLDIACPHRRASLTLGRTEDCGLRCCYHGWLFDTDGACLEMPAEPPGSKLHLEVRQRAAKIQEAGGLVFAYLGPDPAPLFPRYDLLFREDCDRSVWAKEDQCNWAQRAENGVDSFHSMVLHAPVYPSMAMKRPEVTWTQTPQGFRMHSVYPGRKENVSHHIFPSTTRRRNERAGSAPSDFLHFRVPNDDIQTTTFYVKAVTRPEGPYKQECKGIERPPRGIYERVDDEWWGLASSEQDRAAQESQGLIHDRTKEFLATSDHGVVLWRKLVFESIAAVKNGKDPYGIIRDPALKDKLLVFDAGKNFTDHDQPAAETIEMA